MNASNNSEPFVSVVTPVYNGEKYIAECIESVLAQSYSNWEYVIVNNCSKDDTLAIARSFANKDDRIRIYNNDKFLTQPENLNHAFHPISRYSKYCKVVHADDWLFPDCLRLMVGVAESNSDVGMVGAYGVLSDYVGMDGLPCPQNVFRGREIARAYLFHIAKLGGTWVFGSPTTSLLRADLVRRREKFYDESHPHPDSDVCCELLRETDFGFVHQVLTYTRDHPDRKSAFDNRYSTGLLGELMILLKYGRVFLSDAELDQCLKSTWNNYYKALAYSFFVKREKDYRQYHYEHLKKLGYPIRTSRLVKAVASKVFDMLFNPKQTWEQGQRRLRGTTTWPSSQWSNVDKDHVDYRPKMITKSC